MGLKTEHQISGVPGLIGGLPKHGHQRLFAAAVARVTCRHVGMDSNVMKLVSAQGVKAIH